MTGFKITKDHLDKIGDSMSRAGKKSGDIDKAGDAILIPFRAYDDDEELCYEGLLIDDPLCESQTDCLDYCRWDAGCTILKVKRGDQWVAEIC